MPRKASKPAPRQRAAKPKASPKRQRKKPAPRGWKPTPSQEALVIAGICDRRPLGRIAKLIGVSEDQLRRGCAAVIDNGKLGARLTMLGKSYEIAINDMHPAQPAMLRFLLAAQHGVAPATKVVGDKKRPVYLANLDEALAQISRTGADTGLPPP